MTIPNLSDDNLIILDQLEAKTTLGEIIERTLSGFIHWHVIGPNNMKSSFGEFDLYLSVLNGQRDAHLDVLKLGVNVLTFQSIVYPEVSELFNTVSIISTTPDFYDELITRTYKTYNRCPAFESGKGGVEGGGLGVASVSIYGQGGVILNGLSNNIFNSYNTNGMLNGGSAISQTNFNPISSGGSINGGHSIDRMKGDVVRLTAVGTNIVGIAVNQLYNVVYVANGNYIDMYDKAGNYLSTQTVTGQISNYGIALDAINNLLFVSIVNNIWAYAIDGSGLLTGSRTLAYDNSISPNPGVTGYWNSNGPITVLDGGNTIYFSTTGPSTPKVASCAYNNTSFAQASGAIVWPGQMLIRGSIPYCNTGYVLDYNSGANGYDLKYTDFISQYSLTAQLNTGASLCYDLAHDLFYFVGLQSSTYSLYKMSGSGGTVTKVSQSLSNYPIMPSDYDPITNSVFISQYNFLCQISVP